MKITKRFDKKMCHASACPAAMQDEEGNYIFIGEDMTGKLDNLADFDAGIGENETIIRVPKEVFESMTR